MRSAQVLDYQLTLVEASLFRVTDWFHIHLFLSSKSWMANSNVLSQKNGKSGCKIESDRQNTRSFKVILIFKLNPGEIVSIKLVTID